MRLVHLYVNLAGTTSEAIGFYETVFGTKTIARMTFGEVPCDAVRPRRREGQDHARRAAHHGGRPLYLYFVWCFVRGNNRMRPLAFFYSRGITLATALVISEELWRVVHQRWRRDGVNARPRQSRGPSESFARSASCASSSNDRVAACASSSSEFMRAM